MSRRELLLVRSGGDAAVPDWQRAFASLLPDLEVRGWNDAAVRPEDVTYVLVWEPDPGRLATYPNLRVVFSSAAGVDHIVRDPARPTHIPVVRMGAAETAQTVGEFVCMAVLAILRDLPRIQQAQAERRWEEFQPAHTALGTRVGIMGMGRIGQRTAAMLRGLGFPVHGWTRTPREIEGVRGYAGRESLTAFLAATDILVAILPDTAETAGLLDAATLAALPNGAGLVNVGRGSLIVMADLLAALDSGRIGRAVLDVFPIEPLPAEDPAWGHERLIVAPHLAGYAPRPARAAWVVEQIRAHRSGRPLGNVFDPARGY